MRTGMFLKVDGMGIHEQVAAAYRERHPGRDPFIDSLAGLVVAAPPAIEVWFQSFAPRAAQAAIKGGGVEAAPPLEPWIKGVVVLQRVHLAVYGRPADVSPRLSFFFDDDFLQQLLREPPLPVLDSVLRARRELARALSAGDDCPSFNEIAAEFRAVALTMVGCAPEVDVTEDFMTGEFLELVCSIATKLAGAEPARPPRRTPDRVFRAFYEGVRNHYAVAGLGEPTVDDLSDLAFVGGFDRADVRLVRDRWRKRRAAIAESR
ncbi:MAG: hypothetical protein D6689_22715 [Deltaproteobacteria bacterium]|nr:MAG: hypothetical protein D6689_22715 [Deltaproteobacteria bacterium]